MEVRRHRSCDFQQMAVVSHHKIVMQYMYFNSNCFARCVSGKNSKAQEEFHGSQKPLPSVTSSSNPKATVTTGSESGRQHHHHVHNIPSKPEWDLSDLYDFSHKKRGRAIIVNNEQFHSYSGFDSRPGSGVDAKALVKMFEHLGFDVKLRENLKAVEIKQLLERGRPYCLKKKKKK